MPFCILESRRYSRFVRGAWVFCAVLALLPGTAGATTQYTKGNVCTNWSDSGGSAVWANSSGGGYTNSWTGGNDAVFETTAGTVNLVTPVTAHNITFTITGNILSGAGTLTLNGSTPTITLNNGATTVNATIGNNTASVIDGTAGLTLSSALFGNTLTLNPSAASTFTGGLTINGGKLALVYTNLATPTDLINSGNALTVAGGNLGLTGKPSGTTTQTFAQTTINAGGGQIQMNANGGTSTLNLGGGITQTNGGVLFLSPATTWTAQTIPTNEIVNFSGSVTHNGSAVTLPTSGNWGYVGAWFLGGGGGSASEWLQAKNNGDGTYTLSKGPGYSAWVGNGSSSSNVIYTDGGLAQSLSASESMYAAQIYNTLSLNGNTLTLNGIHGRSNGNPTIQGGTLRIGPEKDLVIALLNTTANATATISAPIVDNSGGASGVSVVRPASNAQDNTLYLTATNTFTGPLTISPLMTVTLGDGGLLGSGSYPGAITDNGTALNFYNSGVQTLSGAISGYGVLAVGVGELKFSAPGATVVSTLTPKGDSGGTLHFDNSTSGGTMAWSLGTLTDGAGEYTVKLSGASGKTSTLTFAARSDSTAVTKNFVVAGTGVNGADSKVVFTGQAAGFINARYYFGGASFLSYDSGGYARAFNYASDTSGKSVASSYSSFTAASANGKHVDLDASGSITNGTTESILTLRIGANVATPVTLSTGITLTVSSAGILKAGGNAATIAVASGSATISGGTGDLDVRCDATNDVLTIEPALSISGSTSTKLVKGGAGTLILKGGCTSGNGAFSRVNNGTLLCHSMLGGGPYIVSSGSTLGINGGSGTLSYTGGNPLTVNGGGTLLLGAGGNTLTLSSATAPTLGANSGVNRFVKLKILASGTSLDKVSSAATGALNIANTDLIVDTTGLKAAVSDAVIVDVTGGGTISGTFRSITANNGSTGTVSYTSTQVKLSLTAPLTAPPKGTLLMVK